MDTFGIFVSAAGNAVDFSYEITFDGLGRTEIQLPACGNCWCPRVQLTLTPAKHREANAQIQELLIHWRDALRPAENLAINDDAVIAAESLIERMLAGLQTGVDNEMTTNMVSIDYHQGEIIPCVISIRPVGRFSNPNMAAVGVTNEVL